MKGRLAMLVAVLAAVLIAATGCGGSKKSGASASEKTTTTTTTTSTTTTSSDDGSSSSSSSGSDTDSGSSSSSGTGDVAASQRCVEFAGFASKFSEAFKTTGNAATDGAKLKSYFEALADKAPSDIKSAFQTFADAFGKYFDAIKGIDLTSGKQPSPEDIAKLQSAAKELDKADVKAASQKIQTWVQGGCK